MPLVVKEMQVIIQLKVYLSFPPSLRPSLPPFPHESSVQATNISRTWDIVLGYKPRHKDA